MEVKWIFSSALVQVMARCRWITIMKWWCCWKSQTPSINKVFTEDIFTEFTKNILSPMFGRAPLQEDKLRKIPFVTWSIFFYLSCTAEYYRCRALSLINTLNPRQNGCHFPDIFKWIFSNENAWILVKISLKFVPKGLIDNIPALVLIMAWHRIGNKPLSEPMLTRFIDAYMRL